MPLSRRSLASRAVLALALAAAPSIAAADPPSGLADQVEQLRRDIGVPGVAMSIVENGKVTFARGFGIKRLGAADRVDADTIFPNGSTGKAFTVAALAVLVDQGKLKWDDRVIDHVPWFAMYDSWVTREMTVRDLLVHRSGLGLGEGDLLMVPRTSLSRRESVRRLRYLKPATSFRSAYAYDNVLYMVAGQLIEEVSGETWEDFVASHVLKAAGMKNSTSDSAPRFATVNRAWPHARINGAFRGVGDQSVLNERDELGRNAAPAGGLAVSANDMARWMMIQLAHGKLPEGDGRLFSEAASAEMWKPVVLLPNPPMQGALKDTGSMFNTYALGWNVQDYKGVKIVSHSGAVFGFQSLVVLIPERNVGFTILINSEDGELIKGLQYELLDHYLEKPTQDWPAAWRAYKRDRQAKALAALGRADAARAQVGPSLPLAHYAGDYVDPWYGPIAIREVGGKLRIDFKQTPRMTGTLEHWQYDSFRTRWDDPAAEPAYVTFALGPTGKVDRVTMQAVSPLADFSWDYQDLLFTPVAARR
ncbi:serine hydrolase [Sphingomonas sp. CL5.1]|uniref:serine hydrolase n=1 Tax=Sphingomonas sp. CL5.1 TaxID=2653203 RepID=UPI00158154E3|nr:serine hydrolase [Sphingomonas sp. CL5.1]QKR99802.1 serine hydrolase [Sphingomonas sp. CL5.1]